MENVLLQKEIICLKGSFTPKKIQGVIASLKRLASIPALPKIMLHINSEGGDGGAAMELYDALRRINKPVVGVVIGRAHSAAAFILQACSIRKARSSATIMIHDTRIIMSANIPLIESMLVDGSFRRDIKRWKFHQQKMDYVFADRTRRTIDEVRKKCTEGKAMNVFAAKDFGLIDEVI